MNWKKLKKTIAVAFFVSLSAQLSISLITDGFIVALSPVVMAIFIYCYEDLSSAYIACLSGVFSPAFRLAVEAFHNREIVNTAFHVMPDIAFFFSYAAIYTLIYKCIIRGPKTNYNFGYAIFVCDVMSNIMEISVRSIMSGSLLFTQNTVAVLAFIAFCRTVLIVMVVLAIEAYGNLLVTQEHDREYRRLLTQASAIDGEMRVMEKNVDDVERVTKEAYNLYYYARDNEYPEEMVRGLLDIAKGTHEIKSDYNNVLGVLKETMMDDIKKEAMPIREIVALEKSNVLSMAKKNGYNIEISQRVYDDFVINESFKMMSVIRNLMTNAAESIGEGPGKITISVNSYSETGPDGQPEQGCRICVRDNGPGIDCEDMENLFLEGYSTKFDPKTGNIMRGLGLCLVKDYVEVIFGGRIEITSEPYKSTEFRIMIPEAINKELV